MPCRWRDVRVYVSDASWVAQGTEIFSAKPRRACCQLHKSNTRGGYLRAGERVPGRKIWCESTNPREREMGVKFPLYCYHFGGGEGVGSPAASTAAQ